MKKFLLALLATLLLILCSTCCMATSLFTGNTSKAFSLRNNIKFGMTKQEVIKRETLTLDNTLGTKGSFIRYTGTVADIKNSIIEYHFEDNTSSHLTSVYMGLCSRGNLTYSKAKSDYATISATLTKKYGTKLSTTKTSYSKYCGNGLAGLFRGKSLASMTSSSFYYDFEEWIVFEDDDDFVVIDHFYYNFVGKNGTTTVHGIEYTFYDSSKGSNDI